MKNKSFISLETDFKKPLKLLKELGAKEKTILKSVLNKTGTATKKEIKKKYKSSGLAKRTGALYKAIDKKMFKNGKELIIDSKARSGKNILYGYALAKGSVIKAKTSSGLTFNIAGKWITKHSIKLKETDFINKPGAKYLESNSYKQQLDKIIQSEITKIEKKNAL